MICVYTYVGDDTVHVRRVLTELQTLVFTETLCWKLDSATMEGRYSQPGQRTGRHSLTLSETCDPPAQATHSFMDQRVYPKFLATFPNWHPETIAWTYAVHNGTNPNSANCAQSVPHLGDGLPPSPCTSDEAQQRGGTMDELTALRTLAEHLAAQLGVWHGDLTPVPPPLELLVATVPDDWPARISLPPGATIIGAIRETAVAPGPVRHITLLFDTSLTVEQVRAFYGDRLTQAGWSDMVERRAPMGGFVYVSPAVSFETTTAHDEGGIHLTLDAHAARDGTARVRLIAVVHPPGSAWVARRAVSALHWELGFPHSLLPSLRLPAGTRTRPGGSGGGSTERVESGMEVETDMDRAALTAFLTPQLEQAGWTRQDGGEDGALTWSTWTFADEAGAPWRGVLYVLAHPYQARWYRLSLVAEWPVAHV